MQLESCHAGVVHLLSTCSAVTAGIVTMHRHGIATARCHDGGPWAARAAGMHGSDAACALQVSSC